MQSVIGHLYTFSRSNCDSEANGGPSVVEVLRSPPRESIGPRSVDPKSLEPGKSAAVGEDVKQAQELGMDASRCGYDAGEEGEGHLPRSVGLAVFADLAAGRSLLTRLTRSSVVGS